MSDQVRLTPDLLVRAYANGIFPMGDDRTKTIRWYAPDPRAHLPLEEFHIPHNLRRRVRRQEFSVTSDRAFDRVIQACANRQRTWITEPIIEAYTDLHDMGPAHSVECWVDDDLAGGLYGVALGGAFFGESMFYRVSNASKVALVHLVRQLQAGDFILLDTQYATDHLRRFGVVEIPRSDYMDHLDEALTVNTQWWPLSEAAAADLDRSVDASGNEGDGNG